MVHRVQHHGTQRRLEHALHGEPLAPGERPALTRRGQQHRHAEACRERLAGNGGDASVEERAIKVRRGSGTGRGECLAQNATPNVTGTKFIGGPSMRMLTQRRPKVALNPEGEAAVLTPKPNPNAGAVRVSVRSITVVLLPG